MSEARGSFSPLPLPKFLLLFNRLGANYSLYLHIILCFHLPYCVYLTRSSQECATKCVWKRSLLLTYLHHAAACILLDIPAYKRHLDPLPAAWTQACILVRSPLPPASALDGDPVAQNWSGRLFVQLLKHSTHHESTRLVHS